MSHVEQASLFGSPAIVRPVRARPAAQIQNFRPQDQAVCGIGAGIASTLCMHPLDLLKVKFQVANRSHGGPSIGRQIWTGLQGVVRQDGWPGLYRGLGVNTLGNASSWGLYFLWQARFGLHFCAASHAEGTHRSRPARSETTTRSVCLRLSIWRRLWKQVSPLRVL
jgi:hypothetical protein